MTDMIRIDPILMGILNVTPDSFSDGGRYLATDRAVEHGQKMMEEGADYIDIGGESTRPGAEFVDFEQELRRILPVVQALSVLGAKISVDTRHARTMEAVLDAGASMINDVSALTHDPRSLAVLADHPSAKLCLMHMKGDPKTMQNDPNYDDVVSDVFDYLRRRIDVCVDAGIAVDRIIIDVGIGFGKTLDHNLALLKNLKHFETLGVPMMLAVSRKRYIEGLCPNTPADRRLGGSLATALSAYDQGVRWFRVHDVAQTKQALTVYRALMS